MQLLDFDQRFLQYLQIKNLSPITIGEYIRYLRFFGEAMEFSQKKVDDFLEKKGNRNQVAKAMIYNLKDFLMKAADVPDDIKKNISIVFIPRIKTKKPKKFRILTEEDIKRILDAFKDEMSCILFLISYHCALRRNELLNIKVNDFNWNEWKMNRPDYGRLTVMKPKGGRIAPVLVPDFLMERIMNWVNNAFNPFTFNPQFNLFPLSREKWRRILNEAGNKAIGRNVNPHLLRHSFATHLHQKGVESTIIKEALRHESLSSTQIYTHITIEDIKKTYEKIDRLKVSSNADDFEQQNLNSQPVSETDVIE